MLETVIVILIILGLLGWLVFPIAGSLIHLLLVVVLVVVVIRVLRGRSALWHLDGLTAEKREQVADRRWGQAGDRR